MNRPELCAMAFSVLSLLASLAPVAAAQEESEREGRLQQRLPHLPFLQGGRQSPRSVPARHRRPQGWFDGRVRLLLRHEELRLTWDASNLDQFIENPEKVVHGNGMKPFGGIADAGERKKIVDYLGTLK